MGEFGEGIGSAVEGGLIGRAVEPRHGEPANERAVGRDGLTHESHCLNCGTDLVGPHCHNCGQKAHVHRSLTAIGHDLMHGVLHLDGKLWRTLPVLAFKPGQLTRRYIDGERAKFVSPMAMFLFSFFLMFAVFQMVGLTAPTDVGNGTDVETALVEVREKAELRRQDLQEQIDALPADTPQSERQALEDELEGTEVGLNGLEQVKTLPIDSTTWSINLTGIKEIDDGILKKWRENPGLMLYKLQSNGYKFSWLLIPLSLPFVWLMFAWRRRFHAYDHTVFTTYSLSFMSLLFIALSILTAIGIGNGWVFAALFVIPPIHIYKQFRGSYELSRFSALWRTSLLVLLFIPIILVLFLWALLLLGAF